MLHGHQQACSTSSLHQDAARLSLQLLNSEVGTEFLGASTTGIRKVLGIDAEAVGCVADAVALSLMVSAC